MKIEVLAGQDHLDYALFLPWMEKVSGLLDEFWACDDFDPMSDGELAAVSVLVAGAARAGYTPVAEYMIDKMKHDSSKLCRADLWFNYKDTCRSFEFKNWRDQHRDDKNLELTYTYAMRCAAELPLDAADEIYGSVIAPVRQPNAVDVSLRFAKKSDLAFRFSNDEGFDLFLMFRRLDGYLS